MAPTRYAAGLPYKVHEAAAMGLPVVASELLRVQLGWEDGRDLIAPAAGDAEGFARAVVALCRNRQMWEAARESALRRVTEEGGEAAFTAALGRIMDAVPT